MLLVLAIGYMLTATTSAHADDQPKLDEKELASIRGKLSSVESGFEFAALRARGEKVLPYFAHILADEKSTDRQIERAFIFTRDNLTKYDCKQLIEPTVGLLSHHEVQIRSEAVWLLRIIGSKEDSLPVVAMLYDEDKGVRHCAAGCLE